MAQQGIHGWGLRPEFIFFLGVVGLVTMLWLPSLRAVAQPGARDGRQALEARITRAQQLARAEQHPYTLVFTSASSRVDVVRWVPRSDANRSKPVDVPALSTPLPGGVQVESTTLPGDALVISDSGFILSRGRIVLRAPDGSHERVVINGE